MNQSYSEVATLSSSAALTPVVERKLTSWNLDDQESAVLLAYRVWHLAKTPEAHAHASALIQRAEASLALFKYLTDPIRA